MKFEVENKYVPYEDVEDWITNDEINPEEEAFIRGYVKEYLDELKDKNVI